MEQHSEVELQVRGGWVRARPWGQRPVPPWADRWRDGIVAPARHWLGLRGQLDPEERECRDALKDWDLRDLGWVEDDIYWMEPPTPSPSHAAWWREWGRGILVGVKEPVLWLEQGLAWVRATGGEWPTLVLCGTAVARQVWAPLATGSGHPGGVRVLTVDEALRQLPHLSSAVRWIVVEQTAVDRGGDALAAVLDGCVAPVRTAFVAHAPGGMWWAVWEPRLGPLCWSAAPSERGGDVLVALTARERAEYEVAWGRYRDALGLFRAGGGAASFRAFAAWAEGLEAGRAGLRAWHRAKQVLADAEGKHRYLDRLLAGEGGGTERCRSRRTLVFARDGRHARAVAIQHLLWPMMDDAEGRRWVTGAFAEGTIQTVVMPRRLGSQGLTCDVALDFCPGRKPLAADGMVVSLRAEGTVEVARWPALGAGAGRGGPSGGAADAGRG